MAAKDQIMLYLEERKGDWVSGESLTRILAVSRSTIGKHISQLKSDGYPIESSPKKGYLLQKTSDLLTRREIRDGLETKVLGKRDIVCFTEADSTNTRAKDLATRGAPEGALVLSEKQTSGRGTKARNWFSPPRDGIYLSLILRPAIPPREAPVITLLTAVAVAEALLSLTRLKIAIKWPNDILVSGKKLAGILTEMTTQGDSIDYIVVGLGLNVNTPRFPDYIRDKATSILIETGKRFSRVKVIREYLKWYEAYYEVFKNIGFEPVRKRWRKLTNMIGQQITVEMIDKRYSGEVQDIDKDGALIITDGTGESHRIIFGDVTVI
ncbi:MAG: biotin--[acetyl-CoA-carboxylase] ligase [Deltaproteobacteria bacterium]|nr:biotin--[acetyl-CoA-carboxylase] ligase [Deltaproteobacteria bacterium]MBW2339385.1 biotin--[acetyl-CoA-carboxylase] ligase [Deltaproteobacteria bacterium]